jgi:hypothetical protein
MEKNLNLKQIQEFFSKPLEENTFKVGDKITYLGYPGEITATKEYNGRNFVSVSYDKGKGKTKASDILTTDGTVKAVAEGFKDYFEESVNENLNPEVSNAVNRFIKAMAKRYDYSEQDAVYAIMAALKQEGFQGLNEATEKGPNRYYYNGCSIVYPCFRIC